MLYITHKERGQFASPRLGPNSSIYNIHTCTALVYFLFISIEQPSNNITIYISLRTSSGMLIQLLIHFQAPVALKIHMYCRGQFHTTQHMHYCHHNANFSKAMNQNRNNNTELVYEYLYFLIRLATSQLYVHYHSPKRETSMGSILHTHCNHLLHSLCLNIFYCKLYRNATHTHKHTHTHIHTHTHTHHTHTHTTHTHTHTLWTL